MINILLGAPGGGKSYEAVVYHVLPAVRRGRLVITNLPLSLDEFEAVEPGSSQFIELRTKSLVSPDLKIMAHSRFGTVARAVDNRPFANPEDFASEWRSPEGMGPLYVVDECHFVMPKGGTRIEVEEWFSMHRHYNADVLLMTQSSGKISESIRDLVQTCYKVRKAIAFGKPDSYIRKVLDGVNGGEISVGQRDYKKQFFKLYKSHTKGEALPEEQAQDVSPSIVKFKRMTWAVLIVGAIASAWSISQFFKEKKPQLVPSRQLVRLPSSSVPGAPAVVPTPGQTLQAAPVSALAAAPIPPDLNPEPFATKQVHLTGSATMGKRTIYQFSISQNGAVVMQVMDYDLVKAGYKWAPHIACAGTLTWGGTSRAVVCDSPQVAIGTSGQSASPVVSSTPVPAAGV
jgi:zona occludens toxin